jgi:uncharacterized membrane protein YraQ (UPF0718 family)
MLKSIHEKILVAIFLSILTAIFVTLIIGSIIGYVFTSSLSTNKNWKTIGKYNFLRISGFISIQRQGGHAPKPKIS